MRMGHACSPCEEAKELYEEAERKKVRFFAFLSRHASAPFGTLVLEKEKALVARACACRGADSSFRERDMRCCSLALLHVCK